MSSVGSQEDPLTHELINRLDDHLDEDLDDEEESGREQGADEASAGSSDQSSSSGHVHVHSHLVHHSHSHSHDNGASQREVGASGRRIINILTLNISLPRFIRLRINTATIETQPANGNNGPAPGLALNDFLPPAAAFEANNNNNMNNNNHNNVFSVRSRLFRVIFMKIAFIYAVTVPAKVLPVV